MFEFIDVKKPGWFKKPRRTVRRVFLHCSADDRAKYDNAETMHRWHKEKGWAGIGYHFFIRKSGEVQVGRDINKTPSAQRGHNIGTIAICCHGLKVEKFTEAQQMSLYAMCAEINRQYGGHVTFHGHKEVAAKACPVFPYRRWLNLDRYGNFDGSGLIQQSEPGIVRIGDNGPDVARLQQLLNIPDDGVFGPQTRRHVIMFQKQAGLAPDGIVGPKTWAALEKE